MSQIVMNFCRDAGANNAECGMMPRPITTDAPGPVQLPSSLNSHIAVWSKLFSLANLFKCFPKRYIFKRHQAQNVVDYLSYASLLVTCNRPHW